MPSNEYKADSELVAACAAGDKRAWAEFMRRYRRVIRAAAAQLRQRFDLALADTDDLEHHVYQKLLENQGKRLTAWRGRARYSTYLFEVTRNLVLDYYAARDKSARLEEYRREYANAAVVHPEPEAPEMAEIRRSAVRRAIADLPEKQRLIMQLRLEGKTLSEIAAITKRPLGTIGVENSRALAKIRAAIDETLANAEGTQ